MLPTPDFLYFIEDANRLVYRYENGVLQRKAITSGFPALPHNPDGWNDIEFSFDTNFKYFGLFRTISTPFKFVRKGAQILRELMYKGRGFNNDVYIRILQKRYDRDGLDLCYYGKLDFTTFKDNIGVSVQINSVEGGLIAYLFANDGITYDIVCSENSPSRVRVYFDGVTLQDTYNYSEIAVDPQVATGAHFIPIIFLNNEGDSSGIITGSQNFERIGDPYGWAESTNYIYKTTHSAVDIHYAQPIGIKITAPEPAFLLDYHFYYAITGSDGTHTETSIGAISPITEGDFNYLIEINTTIPPYSQLSIFGVLNSKPNDGNVGFIEQTGKLSFKSYNLPSLAYALTPMALGQALLDKMTGQPGKYIFKSNYLTANANIVTTCGDALRNTDKTSANAAISEYYIASTFEEFFNAYSLVPMSLKITDNILQMEPISTFFGSGNTVISLGEISEVSITPVKDRLINSLQIGYPDQNYDQRAGKYEFNSTQTWKMPTDAVKSELNQVVHYRADCFGIEFIRSNYTGKDSTDNSGDKQPFLIMIDNSSLTQLEYISVAAGTNTTTWTVYENDGATLSPSKAKRFAPGSVIRIQLSAFNDGFYRVVSVSEAVVTVTWIGNTPKTIAGESNLVQVTFDSYPLYRETYTSLSGVLDNTIFNVLLSPKHRLLNWGAYLRSIFFQQPSDQITLTTAAKNTGLMYVRSDGLVFSESAPVTIGNLPAPLFLPYVYSFKLDVPFTFLESMSMLSKGDVLTTHEGVAIFGLPIGKMSCKPATREAQDWQLYVSPRTSLLDLFSLSNFGTMYILGNNKLYYSDAWPVHWKKYDYQKATGIQHYQANEDWEENIYPNYIGGSQAYFQKWKDSDTIKIPFIVNGVANLALYVYDCDGQLYDNGNNPYTLNTLAADALQSPNMMKYVAIPASDFEEGHYNFVIQSGAQKVLISRHQITAYNPAIPDMTMIVKYSNSFNQNDYYQVLGELQLRVECAQGLPNFKGELVDYVNDQRTTEILRGRGYEERAYTFGFPRGIPEWMHMKLNLATMFDNLSIENVPLARDQEFESETFPGYNLKYCTIILQAKRGIGTLIDSVTGDEVLLGSALINVNPYGFGTDQNVVQIQVNG